MAVINDYRRVDGEHRFPGGHDNTGLKDRERFSDEAYHASRALREAIDKSVFRFGFKHGITADESRHLLLNTGVCLPRKSLTVKRTSGCRLPQPASGHMPFPGHRTQQEVREDEERQAQLCNTRRKIRQA